MSKKLICILASFILGVFCAAQLGCTRSSAEGVEGAEGAEGAGGVADAKAERKPLTFERMTRLAGGYADIGNVLELTDQQQQVFTDLYQQHESKFKQWYAVQGKELVGYQKEAIDKLKNFRKTKLTYTGKDPKKIERVRELKAQEHELQSNFEKDLLAAIPPEKLDRWKQHRISTLLLEFLEPLALTDEQVQSVKELAPQALGQLNRKQRSNWQGYGTSKLEKLTAQQVLTAAQKPPYEKMAKRKFSRMFRWNNVSQ